MLSISSGLCPFTSFHGVLPVTGVVSGVGQGQVSSLSVQHGAVIPQRVLGN